MVSVTSDVNASATYQNAPPKPALPDPSQLASNFAAMVDSNLSADPSSSSPPAPEPAPPPPPRAAPGAAASDNNPPRKARASDQPTPSRADESSPPPANDDIASSGAKTDAPSKPGSGKSGGAKNSDGKPADKPSADKASTDNSQASSAADPAKPADTQTVTQNPIAALILPAIPQPNPQATPANANAPLAIAAAAIAATSSTTAATAPPQLANATPAPKATTDAKTPAQTAAPAAAPTQQAASDSTTTTEVAMTVAAATPDAPAAKAATGFKTTQPTQGKSATTNVAGGTQAKTDSSSSAATTANATNDPNAAPQPTTEIKPAATSAPGEAAKADSSGAPATSSTPHEHSAVTGNGPAAPSPIDPNAQLAALPQQPSNAAQVAATDKFTVTRATGAAVPVSGLAVEIAASVHSGKTQFEVRLDPADLGRIDVRIAVDRNGQVTSHLTVEKPETLTMLQQDAPQLQQALNDAGLKTSGGGLQFSLRDQSSSGQNGGNQQSGSQPQPQRLLIREDDTIAPVVAGRSYGRMLGGNGGVDIRV